MKHTCKQILSVILALTVVLSCLALPGVTAVIAAAEDEWSEDFQSYEVNDTPTGWGSYMVSDASLTASIVEDGSNKVLKLVSSGKSNYAHAIPSTADVLTLSYNIKIDKQTLTGIPTFSSAKGSGNSSSHVTRMESHSGGYTQYRNSGDSKDIYLEDIDIYDNKWHTVKVTYDRTTEGAYAAKAWFDGILIDAIGVYNAAVPSYVSMYMYGTTMYLDNFRVTEGDHDPVPAGYTSVKFSKSAYTVGTGETVPTAIVAAPENALVKDTFTYTSDNPDVATVDPATGVITGVSKGTATITATGVNNPNLKATATVNVYYLKTMDFENEAEGTGNWIRKKTAFTMERVPVADTGNYVLKLGANQADDNAEFYYPLGATFTDLTLSYDFMLAVDEGKSETGNNYLPTVTSAESGAVDSYCVFMDALTGYRKDNTTTNYDIKYIESEEIEKIDANKWYHVEIVYTKTGTTKVYINGLLTNVGNRYSYDVKAIGLRLYRTAIQNLYLDNIRISEREREYVIDQEASLGGSIGMGFTGNVEKNSDISQLQVTVGNKVKKYELNEDGSFVLSVPMAAAEMENEISVQPLDANSNAVGRASIYTVKAYLEAVKDLYSDDTYLSELVDYTLSYGAYAAGYFGNTDVTSSMEMAEVPAQGGVAEPVSGELEGISAKSATLLFQDEIMIRYCFQLANGYSASDYTFKVGEQELKSIVSGNLCYVFYDGICPQEYDTEITLSVTKAGAEGELSVTYSAMSYIIRMCNKDTTSDSMKNLLKAMYNYHQKAIAYLANS